MTQDATSGLMDSIFASNDVDMQGRLLKIIQDFLSTTSAKQTESEKGSGDQYHAIETYGILSSFSAAPGVKLPTATVNMDEFIGNAQGFAESGCVSFISRGLYDLHVPQSEFSSCTTLSPPDPGCVTRW